MKKPFLLSAYLVAFAAPVLSVTAIAQTAVSRPEAATFAFQAEKLSYQSSVRHTFESDFTNPAAGSQSATGIEAALTVPVRLTDWLRLQTGISYERFEFGGGNTPLLPEHMQGVAGVIGVEFLVKGKPAFTLRASPGLYFIDNVSGDSFDIPVVLGGAWRFSESFIGLYGVTYSGFRDYPVLPAVGFLWSVTEAIDVNVTFPSPNITFKLDENWRVAIEGSYRGLAVHTDEDVDDPRFRNTELSYRELAAGVSTTYAFNEDTEVRLSAGWTFQRHFKYDSPETSFRAEGAPYVGVSFRSRF